MAQEVNTIETRNTGGSFLDKILGAITGLAETAAPVYALQVQGDILKQQYASQASAASAASAPSTASSPSAGMSAENKKWIVWGLIGAGILVVVGLIFRRR